MKALTSTIGIGLAPLLLSTQVQATSVAVPIASAQQPSCFTSPVRNRGLNAQAALKLKSDVSQKLSELFTVRDKLDKALARMQKAFDNGEEVAVSKTIVNTAIVNIASAESTVEVAGDAFNGILSAERLPCRAALLTLRDETMNGLIATIETMKKIPELAKQIENRQQTVVVIDSSRMAIALNSDRIEMKPGMTREEKRQLILSHAS